MLVGEQVEGERPLQRPVERLRHTEVVDIITTAKNECSAMTMTMITKRAMNGGRAADRVDPDHHPAEDDADEQEPAFITMWPQWLDISHGTPASCADQKPERNRADGDERVGGAPRRTATR